MSKEVQGKDGTSRPLYRFAFRAEIHRAGFQTITEFCEKVPVDPSRVSRILQGWEMPSPKLQRAMAKTLGVTVREFSALL